MKNIAGQLTFDTDFSQLIRKQNLTTDIFEDPIAQAENLKNQISRWMELHGGPVQIPVIERVVITSPAELDATDRKNEQIKKIVRRSNLKYELLKLDRQYTKGALPRLACEKLRQRYWPVIRIG